MATESATKTLTKTCNKCKQEFPATAEFFYRDRRLRSGLGGQCKECGLNRRKEYVNQNRDKVLAYKRRYRREIGVRLLPRYGSLSHQKNGAFAVRFHCPATGGGRETFKTVSGFPTKADAERELVAHAARRANGTFDPEVDMTTLLPTTTRLKDYLKRCPGKHTLTEIADELDVSPKRAAELVEALHEQAVTVHLSGESVALINGLRAEEEARCIDFSKYKEVDVPLGFVADNHLGSKYERMDVLESIYDRFAKAKVKTVYQAGNIIDGETTFNKFDIYAHGLEEQVSNVIEKWPKRKGITTMFVTGDDHEGWYVQREHIDVGRKIELEAKAQGRDDLVHLGYMERDIAYEQPGGKATIRIIHAGGGSTYATSYTSQKYVESLQGGEKPQIVLVGHFHKFDYSYPRNVHVVQGGCTQDQTPFLRKRRIETHVGGVIIWVKQNELGVFTSVKVEWMPYYDKKFYTYHW